MDQGYEVIGCDLSEAGLQQFMYSNEIAYERIENSELVTLSGPGVTLIAGDFMNLTLQTTGPIHAFFDRAATIALPPVMRQAYAKQMASLLRPDTPGLLVSVEYNQNEMTGPPFSVPGEVVQNLYSSDFSVEMIASDPDSEFAGKLRDRGVTKLTESVYRMTRLA